MVRDEEKIRELLERSINSLTDAVLLDFPAESEEEMTKVHGLVKDALASRMTVLFLEFLLNDIIDILRQLSTERKERKDAG